MDRRSEAVANHMQYQNENHFVPYSFGSIDSFDSFLDELTGSCRKEKAECDVQLKGFLGKIFWLGLR